MQCLLVLRPVLKHYYTLFTVLNILFSFYPLQENELGQANVRITHFACFWDISVSVVESVGWFCKRKLQLHKSLDCEMRWHPSHDWISSEERVGGSWTMNNHSSGLPSVCATKENNASANKSWAMSVFLPRCGVCVCVFVKGLSPYQSCTLHTPVSTCTSCLTNSRLNADSTLVSVSVTCLSVPFLS